MKFKSKCGKYNILIDAEDYNFIMDFAPNGWEIKHFKQSNNPYVITRKTITVDGKRVRKQFYLHRVVMNVLDDPKKIVDHIFTNTLDNRKSKLRIVTHRENMKNRTSKKNSACKYLGVSYCKSVVGNKKFRVNIKDINICKSNIHLGYYLDENSAGYAYNLAADIIHREFAKLNDVDLKYVNYHYIQEYVFERLNKLNININGKTNFN